MMLPLPEFPESASPLGRGLDKIDRLIRNDMNSTLTCQRKLLGELDCLMFMLGSSNVELDARQTNSLGNLLRDLLGGAIEYSEEAYRLAESVVDVSAELRRHA